MGTLQEIEALVDLEQAYRNLLCEEFSREDLPAQMLLVPLTLHLSPREAQLAEEHLERLQSFGFGMRSLGGGSYLVEAVPPRIGPEAAQQVLLDLLDRLTRKSDVALELINSAEGVPISEQQLRRLVDTG